MSPHFGTGMSVGRPWRVGPGWCGAGSWRGKADKALRAAPAKHFLDGDSAAHRRAVYCPVPPYPKGLAKANGQPGHAEFAIGDRWLHSVHCIV